MLKEKRMRDVLNKIGEKDIEINELTSQSKKIIHMI